MRIGFQQVIFSVGPPKQIVDSIGSFRDRRIFAGQRRNEARRRASSIDWRLSQTFDRNAISSFVGRCSLTACESSLQFAIAPPSENRQPIGQDHRFFLPRRPSLPMSSVTFRWALVDRRCPYSRYRRRRSKPIDLSTCVRCAAGSGRRASTARSRKATIRINQNATAQPRPTAFSLAPHRNQAVTAASASHIASADQPLTRPSHASRSVISGLSMGIAFVRSCYIKVPLTAKPGPMACEPTSHQQFAGQ